MLKQALLRRGIPRMIVVDNGAAYRAATLQTICADLGIRLVHCQPYQHPRARVSSSVGTARCAISSSPNSTRPTCATWLI
ncbi:integrase catalytic domain-containing protein [Burkholderia pyrrocinia]|uniref:integrase catalytic domain-containing protein n=1 Tax=Burkholderia pyrrocinia TaxID=60550 RepID=UPI001FC813C4|nr:transposase family protein [Burkholderia pyrrocinia]